MKTENHSINDVLAKNATSFFIPPFQRAYAWGKPEIERYFSDVIRIIDSELDSNQHDKLEHFFGSIVVKEEMTGFANKSVVVDGQQRLTTTLLFLIALRDIEKDETNQEYINQNYLTNNTSSFQDKIKLKQVTKDWDSYRALVKRIEPRAGTIHSAYQLFSKLIQEKRKSRPEIVLEHYITAIRRMNVAVIFLDERPFKGEDPQIIFETLNSLGKPLTLSDLVRNYILLNMDSHQQSDIYENIWHPQIEDVLKEHTSAFFRDYLQYKTVSPVKFVSNNNTKEIYQLFKSYVETNFSNREEFIEDIVPYVEYYKWIVFEQNSDSISPDYSKNKEIIELTRNIFHDIKAEAFKPFVLGLFKFNQNANDSAKLTDEILISTLQTIRTYLIRRRILGLTQGENKSIVLLCDRVEEIAKSKKKLIDLLSGLFYKMRFPNDIELSNKLKEINFYEGLKKYSKFILGKIEENNTKVAVDFRNPMITIEHIMPQTLTESWENELGVDYSTIHKSYLHNIGNLILTEFNSEIGNKSFNEKKTILQTSSLNFRLSIINKSIWNEESIEEHRAEMITWLLETFALPSEYRESENWNSKITSQTSFSPLDIDAGDIAAGNKPKKMTIDNQESKVSTWQDVFIKFIGFIKDHQQFDFDFLLNNQLELFGREETIVTWHTLKSFIEESPERLKLYKSLKGKKWDKIKDLNEAEIFVHINISATTCLQRIANVMDKFYMPEDSVLIELK